MITNNIKEQLKLEHIKTINTYKCKCGHSVVIYPFEHKSKKICKWCGEYVYVNKKEEFKDRMRGKLK